MEAGDDDEVSLCRVIGVGVWDDGSTCGNGCRTTPATSDGREGGFVYGIFTDDGGGGEKTEEERRCGTYR